MFESRFVSIWSNILSRSWKFTQRYHYGHDLGFTRRDSRLFFDHSQQTKHPAQKIQPGIIFVAFMIDLVGRRPCLVVGFFGAGVSTLGFGLVSTEVTSGLLTLLRLIYFKVNFLPQYPDWNVGDDDGCEILHLWG